MPKRGNRTAGGTSGKRAAAGGVLFAFSCAFLVVLAAWTGRFAWATWAARRAFDRLGFSDASFRFTRLSPFCVTLEDFRLGGEQPSLTIDWLELRFSIPDVFRGRIDRLRARGVEVPLVTDGTRVRAPLLERTETLMSPRRNEGPSSSVVFAGVPVGEAAVYDLRVPVRTAVGEEAGRWVCNLGAFSEAEDAHGARSQGQRVRFWGDLSGEAGVNARVSGALTPSNGAWQASAELTVERGEALVACLRRIAPNRIAAFPVLATNVGVTVRGTLSARAWTQVDAFESALELKRGSGFTWGERGEHVRFQTFRVEASGTPRDAQARFSAGVSGFRAGGGVEADAETGRLFGARGTVRFRQTETNRVVCASGDADLPGRTAVRVLSHVLPLIPRLMTDGGTLHAEADLAQPLPGGKWRGEIRSAAETRRSAAALPQGRVGAGRVEIGGVLDVEASAPGTLRTSLVIEDGYFFKRGVSTRGGVRLALLAEPPYRTAEGTFEGRIDGGGSPALNDVSLSRTECRFEGRASVEGLVSNPVWRVSLGVPETPISLNTGESVCRAVAGASARGVYGRSRFSFSGDAWLRDLSATVAASSSASRVDAVVQRMQVHVDLPETDTARASRAAVRVGLSVSGAGVHSGGGVAAEGVAADLPLAWSPADGWTGGEGARLTWRRLEAQGVRVVPRAFSLRAADNGLDAALDVAVENSRFGASVRARLPFAAPGQAAIDVSVPETSWDANDAAWGALHRLDTSVAATGRARADAHIRFLGHRPIVEGNVQVSDGRVTRDGLSVEGLRAVVPFACGLSVRTVGRPFVAFDSAKIGNVRLDDGRIEFQITPEEIFVDRAEVGWCKGRLQVYSIHLDPKHPKADAVVYADRIDLGEALMMVVPLKGRMEGVLYGRFPVGIDNGRVRLSTGYLYSLPGQGGTLRLDGNAPMRALLERAGVTGDVQEPLSKALSDMDFSAVRLELTPKTDGDAVLSIKVDGKSNFKEWPAPVDLELNLHGPLEKLLNVGLDVSRKR